MSSLATRPSLHCVCGQATQEACWACGDPTCDQHSSLVELKRLTRWLPNPRPVRTCDRCLPELKRRDLVRL